MRPVRPWLLEPTLRFLAALPLVLAVCGFAVELAARALSPDATQRPVWLLVAGTGATHVAALALVVPLLRSHGFTWNDAFGVFSPGWPRRWLLAIAWTLPAAALAWVLHQASGWLLDRFSIAHDTQAAVEAVRQARAWWERGGLFLFAAITAPVVEETLFRGILWPLARDSGWPRTGALGVGLLFAVIHFNLAAFVPLGFLGIFWIWLYERSADLTTPILSHALFNAANFLWLLVSASVTVPTAIH